MARTRSKLNDAPKPEPRLRIPLADAEAKIAHLIEQGQLLDARSAENRDLAEELLDDVSVWQSYVLHFFSGSFVNAEVFVDYFNTDLGDDKWRTDDRPTGMMDWITLGWDLTKIRRIWLKRLESIKKQLPLLVIDVNPTANIAAAKTERPVKSGAVFLVHGHHEESKQSIARLVEKLHLEAIILDEQSSAGNTVIEKFEHHSDVAFAVILLMPDDIGSSKSELDKLKPRARQNVVLELGFFIAKLGRQRVAILYIPGVELPSDISGLLYIEYEKSGAWKLQLAKEMRTAGLQVDLNEIM